MGDSMAGTTRVLITGATGFVGSHVVEALAARGFELRALVRPTSDTALLEALGVERVVGGLGDAGSVARAVAGADRVVHLAAVTRARTAEEYHRVNAAGTRTLVEAVDAASPRPRRLVYLSSLAAVGPATDGRPVSAETEPRPLTAYGRSKLEGERICARIDGDVEVTVLRAPTVYGPRDRDLLTYFRLAGHGFAPVPRGPGRPLQFVHAADLADAVARAVTADRAAGIYHAAEPRAYTWREVAGRIATAVGREARPIPIPAGAVRVAAAVTEFAAGVTGRAPIFNRDKVHELLAPAWLCETERAETDLGFTARIPLGDGLADTAAWYRARGWL